MYKRFIQIIKLFFNINLFLENATYAGDSFDCQLQFLIDQGLIKPLSFFMFIDSFQ